MTIEEEFKLQPIKRNKTLKKFKYLSKERKQKKLQAIKPKIELDVLVEATEINRELFKKNVGISKEGKV